jgi:HAD superfamily hydrolase (TIGR01549 family)
MDAIDVNGVIDVIDVGRIETLLFDVDGTLIDSNAAHTRAWVAALHEHGVAIRDEEVRRLIGMGGDKLLPAAAKVDERSMLGQAIVRRKKALFDALLPSLEPMRGARSLLEYMSRQGIDVAIATSADDRELNALLKRAGVDDLIPMRSSKDDAPESKPDPDIVNAALHRAKARPELSLLIGDTPYDIEAARRAGVGAIALRCGGYWSDESLRGAAGIFDDPEALLVAWFRSAGGNARLGGQGQ